jgi:hypothetical protein
MLALEMSRARFTAVGDGGKKAAGLRGLRPALQGAGVGREDYDAAR